MSSQPPAKKRRTSQGAEDAAASGGDAKQTARWQEIQRQRAALPLSRAKQRLLEEVAKHDVLVLVGETGSGKTTQIPQFLHDAGYTKKGGMVGCTQPRRVAALTVSRRVSEEMAVKLGEEVGYSVRFDDCTSRKTRIKYMTDGMLLREAMTEGNGDLKGYSVIILDEAHERTLHTDVLFAIVKSIRKRRKDLKILVMSATLDADQFSAYFDNAPVVYVEGRHHHVSVMFTEQPQPDYLDAALVASLQIHRTEPLPGDILLFLTGQDEIESMERLLRDALRKMAGGMSSSAQTLEDGHAEGSSAVRTGEDDVPPLEICPIFAALPSHMQMRAFERPPPGTRKIILATNIAETSITISGIRYVVDPGVVKARTYNPRTGMDALVVQPVSKAQARQRSGRAGREADGVCFRLYTEDTFMTLDDATVPEIRRVGLAGVVLQLKALGIDDVVNFDYMDRPDTESLVRAIEALLVLKAIDSEGGRLTELGKRMAAFPLDPALARAILASCELGCAQEVLTIVAILSADVVFFSPNDKREAADAARRRFASSEGDHLTYLSVYRGYRAAQRRNEEREWCTSNFVNGRTMRAAVDIRAQLKELCERLGLRVESSGNDTAPLRKALLAGLFQNVAAIQPDNTYKTILGGHVVAIHPSSVLFNRRPACLLYSELVHTTKKYMRDVSVIDPSWLFDVAPTVFAKTQHAQ